jgi:hypothetical protein
MGKFKIEKGASRVTRVKLQATIEESIAADLSLMCEWSNNEKNYVVNELLRFAVAEDSEFQRLIRSLLLPRVRNQKRLDPLLRQDRRVYRRVTARRPRQTQVLAGACRSRSMVRGLKSRLKMLPRVFVRNRFLLSVGLSVATGLVVKSVIQIPDSDPLLRYAAFERPAMYQAFIVSYALFLFTTPFLLLSMCLSLLYIHFYEEQIQQAAGVTLPYPKPEFRKELFLILGELHEQVEPVPAAHPKWLNIPERGLYTGIASNSRGWGQPFALTGKRASYFPSQKCAF